VSEDNRKILFIRWNTVCYERSMGVEG